MNNELKFYEFFAGAGMVRYALQPEWICAWANDNDPRKARLYAHNFGSTEFDSRDVACTAASLSGRDSKATSTLAPKFPIGISMAWASFPCQDLSLAGWQRGMVAKRSGTYWAFYEVMSALLDKNQRPPIVVLENVPGLLYGESFRGLCESLAALHMNFGAMLIDAKYFVPQSRPRVFIVAVDDRIDTSQFEVAQPAAWHNKAVVAAHRQVPEDLSERWKWWNVPQPNTAPPTAQSLVQSNQAAGAFGDREVKRILKMMTPPNLKRISDAKRLHVPSCGFLYKRTREGVQRAEVRFDGIAGCLRTPRGGSSRQTVVLVKNKKIQMRLLTPIEAARLMGIPLDERGRLPGSITSFFPENFTYNEAYLSMGDGVAVPVVRHLAKHLLTPLARLAAHSTADGTRNSLGNSQQQWRAKSQARVAEWTQAQVGVK